VAERPAARRDSRPGQNDHAGPARWGRRMMADTGAALPAATLRRDPWWLEILPTIALLGGFTLYALYVIFVNNHYYAEPYLSPFYSPCLAAQCQHLTLPLVGRWWTLSPALLVLWAPLGFRATCYYYRKAYYRAFFWAPPACAVRDLPKAYAGETRFPFLFQNVHRYFFYLAVIVVLFLWWDAHRYQADVEVGERDADHTSPRHGAVPFVEAAHGLPEPVPEARPREGVDVTAAHVPAGVAGEGVGREQEDVGQHDQGAYADTHPLREAEGQEGVPPQ